MYTKGGWEADTADSNMINVFSSNQVVAICRKDGWDLNIKEAEANAQLIASAPDMYEALKAALDFFTQYDIQQKVISGISLQLNQALAKAEGK